MRNFWAILFVLGMWWLWNNAIKNQPRQAETAPPPVVASELSSMEKDYYRQVFDYTMEAVGPGESYGWKANNGFGQITVFAPFKSKSGSQCRNFKETMTVGGVDAAREGVACKREGRDGWCRLEKGQSLTCALEKTEGLVDSSIRNAGDVLVKAKRLLPF